MEPIYPTQQATEINEEIVGNFTPKESLLSRYSSGMVNSKYYSKLNIDSLVPASVFGTSDKTLTMDEFANGVPGIVWMSSSKGGYRILFKEDIIKMDRESKLSEIFDK